MKKILIVDDDYFVREVLSEHFLALYQVKIIEAESSQKAIKVMRELMFDLIICDYEMPMGNGKQVYEHFRMNHLQGNFIFFTGLDSHEFIDTLTTVNVVYGKKFQRLFDVIEEKKFLLLIKDQQ